MFVQIKDFMIGAFIGDIAGNKYEFNMSYGRIFL